jgi:SPP1 gp7 family putative phage head morphogenesis protein
MTLEQTAARLRKQATQADAAAMERIITAHTDMDKALMPYIDALTAAMERDIARGIELTRAHVERMPEYRRLMDAIETELDDYSTYMSGEVKTDARRSGGAGLATGALLLLAALGDGGVPAKIARDATQPPPPGALDFLDDYLDPDGPLMTKIKNLSPYYSDAIRQLILDGVGSGLNPLTIAKNIIDNGLGMSLTDAMRWTRTVQLYSYRWANAASYQANSEIVKGWIWYAELDDKTCMSCISLHGKVFTLEDGIPNDHYNGRCAMLPYIPGITDDIVKPGAGREWFEGLPDESQQRQMGYSKWEAWNDEKFGWDDLSVFHADDVFGDMRTEPSLKELLSNE